MGKRSHKVKGTAGHGARKRSAGDETTARKRSAGDDTGMCERAEDTDVDMRKRVAGADGDACGRAGGAGADVREGVPNRAAAPSSCDAPAVDELPDIPSWADLRFDEAQGDAFQTYRAAAERPDELRLGCVVRLDRGFPLVATDGLTLRAEHAVAFAKRERVSRDGERLLPAVGDWVAVRCDAGHDRGVIEHVLPRRTAFERWRGKNRGERQVLAANIDIVLIVQALGGDARGRGSFEIPDASRSQRRVPSTGMPSAGMVPADMVPAHMASDAPAANMPPAALRPVLDRIARSLVLARDCGAVPAVVLTKADRCSAGEVSEVMRWIHRLAGEDLRVVSTSSAEGQGLEGVRSLVPKGTLGMILGESGAGKSTLLNALLGHEVLATGAVRARDDAGRHTTVARIMVSLPGESGVIADAPGLRSLPLVGHERGLARSFPDIIEAAHACRFRDCTHTHEPGCAVREAVAAHEIEEIRVDEFLALAHEMRVSAQSLDPDVHLS